MDTPGAPSHLGELVAWLVREWQAELPMTMTSLSDCDPVGPGVLGAPRWTDEFRAYLTASPFATDARPGEDLINAVHIRPMHAAMFRLAGRDNDNRRDSPFMARFLWAVACSGGDWQAVCERLISPPQVWRIYTAEACRRLYAIWSAKP